MILCAPSEPPQLRALGVVCALPEESGSDFIVGGQSGTLNVQRKTVSDLIASLADGRLGREIDLLSQTERPALLIEGRPQWTNDGRLADRSGFQKRSWHGIMLAVLWASVGIVHSDSLEHTSDLLRDAERWLEKSEHYGLRTAPVIKDGFGDPVPWGVLLGVNGVGPKLAEAIHKQFGRVPLRWDVSQEDLQQVPGVVKVRAERLWQMFS